jgi:hypothetical protein
MPETFSSAWGTTPRAPAGTVRLTVAQALVKTRPE